MPLRSPRSPTRLLRRMALVAAAGSILPACTAFTVAGAAVGVAATGVGLAVDAGAGAVRLTGRAVGAAADAVLPGKAD